MYEIDAAIQKTLRRQLGDKAIESARQYGAAWGWRQITSLPMIELYAICAVCRCYKLLSTSKFGVEACLQPERVIQSQQERLLAYWHKQGCHHFDATPLLTEGLSLCKIPLTSPPLSPLLPRS